MDAKSDVESWLKNEGAKFLRRIGLRPGARVVDFGCGSAHYSIPAAQFVEKKGKVFAVEQDQKPLLELKKRARLKGLDNLTILKNRAKLENGIPANSIDVILAYDVLHYLPVSEREELYHEFRRILRGGGLLSVYPKHYRDDFPLRELAHLSLEQIVMEIIKAEFSLQEIYYERLIHDDSYNRGYILNFSPAK